MVTHRRLRNTYLQVGTIEHAVGIDDNQRNIPYEETVIAKLLSC